MSWVNLSILIVGAAFGIGLLIQFIRGVRIPYTQAGILGTFAGISISLFFFDVSDVQKSLHELLGGMRFAFLTSVAGLLGELLIPWRLRQWPPKTDPAVDTKVEITDEDLYRMLESIRQAITGEGEAGSLHDQLQGLTKAIAGEKDDSLNNQLKSLRTEQRDHLAAGFQKLTSAITGEEEGSLQNQLKGLRADIIDGQNKLTAKFEEFGEQVAKLGSEAIIEALKEVIEQFNHELKTQFGENFKQLNEAVGKLLDWQEKYRTHIKETGAQLEATLTRCQDAVTALQDTAAILEKTRGDLQGIAESTEGIPATMKLLDTHLATQAKLLTSIQQLGEEAKTAFPTIQKNLSDLTTNLEKEITHTIQAVQSATSRAATHVESTAGQMETNIQERSQQLNQRLIDLDEKLQKELERGINAMGTHLARLSAKFVEDYGPLTEELRRVVAMAEDLRRGNGGRGARG